MNIFIGAENVEVVGNNYSIDAMNIFIEAGKIQKVEVVNNNYGIGSIKIFGLKMRFTLTYEEQDYSNNWFCLLNPEKGFDFLIGRTVENVDITEMDSVFEDDDNTVIDKKCINLHFDDGEYFEFFLETIHEMTDCIFSDIKIVDIFEM